MSEDHDSALQLDDVQLAAFDTEYVQGDLWDGVIELVTERFGGARFTILDIGGGNGRFTDALLDRFPEATATLVDNSALLLERNTPRRRKELICASATDLGSAVGSRQFDLICLHWVLHHFVTRSYQESRLLQLEVLRESRDHLSESGRLSVFEDLYDGALMNRLPGRAIYALTSLHRLAPLIRRLGANTAGCGVCFLSGREWLDSFSRAGLEVERQRRYPGTLGVKPFARVALQIASAEKGHYWLSASR